MILIKLTIKAYIYVEVKLICMNRLSSLDHCDHGFESQLGMDVWCVYVFILCVWCPVFR
jgi:hypothetical protein